MSRPLAERCAGTRRKLKSVFLDTASGEIVEQGEGAAIFISKPRMNGFSEGFLTMGQAAADVAAEFFARAELTGKDAAVLFRLIALLDMHNFLEVNQADLAKSLKMQRPHVARSIRQLVKLEILLQGPRNGIVRTYKLNPSFGWKGPNKKHKDAIIEEMSRRGWMVVEGTKVRDIGTFEQRKSEVAGLRKQRLQCGDFASDEERGNLF